MPLNTVWMKFRAAGAGASKSSSTAADTVNVPDPRLSVLEVKIADVDHINIALQQIRNVLMATHKGIEDFSFRTQEEWAENINTFIHNARMSGGIIAGISLLVGGIGIMNIMLASISERVREIGIRKAVGAATEDVFVQILVESIVIAVLGGLVGLIASYGLVRLIVSFSPTDNAPIITITAMAIAFFFSACVGIVAGLFPAFKAARLDPIQALRYE
jgi:putative ABC transport system permease protein